MKRLVLIKKELKGFSVGSKVRVEVDEKGNPVEVYWRKRLEDAKIDDCCELIALDDEKAEEIIIKDPIEVKEDEKSSSPEAVIEKPAKKANPAK